MPVRSFDSPVLRWPKRAEVDAAVRSWATGQPELHPELLRLGYFGSYARGDWGVGSDVDLVAVVARSERPWLERGLDWNTLPLPVPADLLVYTQREWDDALVRGEPFVRTAAREAVWVYEATVQDASSAR